MEYVRGIYVVGTMPGFTTLFTKLRQHFYDFLFASQDDETLSNEDLHLKERICSLRSKFFLLIDDPCWEKQQQKMAELLP